MQSPPLPSARVHHCVISMHCTRTLHNSERLRRGKCCGTGPLRVCVDANVEHGSCQDLYCTRAHSPQADVVDSVLGSGSLC